MEEIITNGKGEKKDNLLQKVKKAFVKDEDEFSAKSAWLESTYGIGNLSTEERILDKQNDIKRIIRSRFRFISETNKYRNSYPSYHCVIDIEEDLVAHKEEVLKPFSDSGFKIINLSDTVDEIKDENVYLISWKNVFKDK